MVKKVYKAPQLTTEKVEIGVFGSYGEGGWLGSFIGVLNPLFGACCS